MRKQFTEGVVEGIRRVKKHGARPPLRTFSELCSELGISEAVLRGKMKLEGAPKPIIDNRSHSKRARVCWYNPQEFKAWVKTQDLTPQEKKPPTRNCEECGHFFFYPNGKEAEYVCRLGHSPRFYKQKNDNPHDTDWGYKRRCADYSEDFK